MIGALSSTERFIPGPSYNEFPLTTDERYPLLMKILDTLSKSVVAMAVLSTYLSVIIEIEAIIDDVEDNSGSTIPSIKVGLDD